MGDWINGIVEGIAALVVGLLVLSGVLVVVVIGLVSYIASH